MAMATSTPVLARWLTTTTSDVGRHTLHLMTEIGGTRALVLDDLRETLRTHYVSPAVAADRLARLGSHKTAELLRVHLPTTKKARSGDLGEVLATEAAEHTLKFNVPIRRLRWKDGRDMALRGDDIIGVRVSATGQLTFLKGESKSRAALSTAVLDEAGEALNRDGGRPTRHSVIFVAERLRELGNDSLALRLEEAALDGFKGRRVEHLLFAVAGSNPEQLLRAHLTANAARQRNRHAMGVHIANHGAFIATLFGGL